MYNFVDTLPGSAGSTSMSIQTVFNNFNLDNQLTDTNGSFLTLSVSGRSNITKRIRTIGIPGMDGVFEQDGANLEPREIIVKYKITDKTNDGLRNRFNRLNSILKGSKKELIFTDEDSLFYATMQLNDVPEEDTNDLVGTITFLCSDPFKYGPEKSLYFPSDVVVVENEGTAEADPIFELTAKEKTTFAMVSNETDNYNLIGTPVDDDVEVVDTKTSVLYENGNTLDQWQQTQSPEMINNDSNIDSMDGVMGTDDAGIRATNYGTARSKQRGPAIFKDLVNPIQDFEMETTFDIISRREIENFRIMIYLNDENMNPIGQVGLKDNNKNYKRRRPIAILGEHLDVTLMGDDGFTIDNARDTTLFYLRVKREGNRFTFYVGEWKNHKHVNVWEETFIDTANEYNGRLRYITLFIGSYQSRVAPARLRMNSVEVFELQQLTVDQTPYILDVGDTVLFDHKNEDILINGEPRNDLKNFGGSFFKLKEGENMLVVTPENSFDAKVTFRDKFL